MKFHSAVSKSFVDLQRGKQIHCHIKVELLRRRSSVAVVVVVAGITGFHAICNQCRNNMAVSLISQKLKQRCLLADSFPVAPSLFSFRAWHARQVSSRRLRVRVSRGGSLWICWISKNLVLAGLLLNRVAGVRRSALSFGNAKHFRRATRTINCCGKVLSAQKFKAKFSLNARAHFYLGFIMLSYATFRSHTNTRTLRGLCIESNDYTLTFCFSSVRCKIMPGPKKLAKPNTISRLSADLLLLSARLPFLFPLSKRRQPGLCCDMACHRSY